MFQTAYRADQVIRGFRAGDGTLVRRSVPGSFYEFITRKRMFDAGTRKWTLDLRFDAGNAQGIFKMTAGGEAAAQSVPHARAGEPVAVS